MGRQYASISLHLQTFIKAQKLFFVATAGCDGRVNVLPKGLDSLRVLDENTVLWLNGTGSGNETAAHLLENNRMTLMFCALEGAPMILRLYGTAEIYHPRDAGWDEFIGLFPTLRGSRQLFKLRVDLVQTSCGFGVPFFDYAGDRPNMPEWAERKGEAGIRDYWQEKNRMSLDGKPTQIFSREHASEKALN